MRVKVYMNVEEDEQGNPVTSSRFGEDRYQLGDQLQLVYDYTVEDVGMNLPVNTVLENTFAMLNRGSGSFVGDYFFPYPSLIVGDVIDVDGEKYSVEPIGFRLING
jgi:hypothetical protein